MHVAIVTFGYPPLKHVSGTRPSHMARELGRLGHDVTVVTVDWSTRENPRPEVERVEVLAIDPRSWLPSFSDKPPLTTEPGGGPRVLQKARTLRRTLRYGPYETWARVALSALLAKHRSRPVDVVWAIHGDDSCHEIAYRFSRATKVPWVADFKDPWDLFHKPAVRWLQELVTKRRLRTASALTETCQAQGDSDSARFSLPAHVLWTGYDADVMERAVPEKIFTGRREGGKDQSWRGGSGEADESFRPFPPSRLPVQSSPFTLAYIGNLAPQHDIDAVARLFAAWDKLGDKPAELELHAFCNDVSALKRKMEARGVSGYLHAHSFVPRERAYSLMKGADALLLLPATFLVPSGGSIGVKELEYLASGTPVLSIGKLLPELDEVAAGCPQLAVVPDGEAGAEWIAEEALSPGRSRAGVNGASVAAHSWPAKGKALESVLAGVASRR